jgi:hypothetical protein
MMENSKTSMQDFIKLETTLYSLTTRCMKVCNKFIDNQITSETPDGQRSSKNPLKTKNQFDICLNKCTQDYAALHQFVRMKFIQDLDSVYQHNQTTYQNFYST